MTDKELIEKFENYLYAVKNYSVYTVNGYKKDVEDFYNFIRENKFARGLADIRNDRVCHNYLSNLVNQKYSAKSINRKISSLRTFYNFLLKEHIVDFNYFTEIKNVKEEKKLPRFIDQDDIMILIDSIDTDSDLGFRNRCLVELMYATGMRVSEVCSLEVKDINFYSNSIIVTGKGNKDRVCYMYDDIAEKMNHYINFTRSNLLSISGRMDVSTVFINYKGTPLTPRGVRKILNTLIDKSALERHISPHMIRHSFATSMLNNGMDLRSVQELLGHENLSTTQIYTHVTTEDIKNTYEKAFPRANSQKK